MSEQYTEQPRMSGMDPYRDSIARAVALITPEFIAANQARVDDFGRRCRDIALVASVQLAARGVHRSIDELAIFASLAAQADRAHENAGMSEQDRSEFIDRLIPRLG